MEVRRGDVWYVNTPQSTGCEQRGIRPAIIVSNNCGNKHSPVIEVVFITSAKKKHLPTHVDVSDGVAICEQIHSVDKSRLLGFKRKCTTEEMMSVNRGLMISLGIIA